MAVTKLSNSGIKTGILKYDSMLAGNAPYLPGAFESIATITLGSNGTPTFSSIPQTYTHLQIRAYATTTTSGTTWYMIANGDTSITRYTQHGIYGNGVSYSGFGYGTGNISGIPIFGWTTGSTLQPAAAIIDIQDYASTSRFKTIRSFSGNDTNGSTSGDIELNTGVYASTSAVDSLTINNTFTTGSTFALYGIKG